MPLKFDVTNNAGETKPIDVNMLAKTLASKGEQVQGVSPDGMSISIIGKNGLVNVPVQQAFSDLGFQAANPKPIDADYSQVSPESRAAIEALGDPNLQKAYLQESLARKGIDGAKVIGQGRDYFYFDPKVGKYVALTNNPNWDVSDLAEAGVAAPKVVGSILGGTLGATLGAAGGPAAVAGGIGGAAAGSAAGSALARGAVAAMNPEVKNMISEHPGTVMKEIGKGAAFDAAGYGIPMAGGALAGKMFGKGAQALAENGLASTAARGAGWVGENAGRVVNKVAGAVDTPLGADIVAGMGPVTGDVMGAGMMAQLPSQAVRGAANGMGWLGERQTLKSLFPEAAAKLRANSEMLTKPLTTPSNFTNEFGKGAQNIANKMKYRPGPSATDGGTETVMGNLGSAIKRKILKPSYDEARKYGMTAEEALNVAKESSPSADKWAGGMRSAGRGLENLENFGKQVEAIGVAPVKAAAKAAKYGGYALGKGGSLLKAAGTIGQPIENRLLMSHGAEELYNDLQPKRPWQKEPNQSSINSVLASYDL